MTFIGDAIAWLANPAHWQGPSGVPVRLGEHLVLSGASLAIALLIGLPIGIWVGHTGRLATFAVNLANIGRAMPSLAVIAIVLPITAAIDPQAGFKFYPTLIAMVVLAIPPILVNAYAGIVAVDKELVEAARGMGMRERQVLWGVEMPIAIPLIAAGVRLGAVQIVATATLGAVFGFGGLGRLLVEGVAQNDTGQTWAGVFLVAALAIAVEAVFGLLVRVATSRGLRLERERLRAPDQQVATAAT